MSPFVMTLPPSLVSGIQIRTGTPEPMDEARFEAFYRRTSPSLWSYLHRISGDPSVADDLLQKAFLRYLNARPEVVSEEHQRRWLFKTATNLAVDHFREAKRERGRSEAIAAHDALHRTEARDPLQQDMVNTFNELKPRERALLWLAHVEEAGHQDIGEALGVKTRSVKVLLFRARRRLAEMLRKKGLGPEVKR